MIYPSTRVLENLTRVLHKCEEVNLVLNWEKCHFMVQEGVVLGHVISSKSIKVDKAKVKVVERLPPPNSVKGCRVFLVIQILSPLYQGLLQNR